jgi:hypothetical protein
MFNPEDWIPKPAPAHHVLKGDRHANFYPQNQFERVLQQIERRGIDIAPDYERWRNLGFAIASEFSETGREYFHRLSRFYAGYSSSETDKQYTRCLRGKDGISIKTFFYTAKNNGIKI